MSVKLVVLVLVSVVIGWVVRGFYVAKTTTVLTPKREKRVAVECEDTAPEIVEKIVEKEVIQYVPQTKIVYRDKKEEDNSTKDLFLVALGEKKFYKAMEYYEGADEEKYPNYRKALYGYFIREGRSRGYEIIDQLNYYVEMEPNNKEFVFLLSRFYKQRGNIEKAIETLVDFSNVAQSQEIPLVINRIKTISLEYVSRMVKNSDYKRAIDFLKNQINVGMLSEFFSYELATVYYRLKKYVEAKTLLEELTQDDVYKEQALRFIAHINEKLMELKEYPTQIPLMRSGLHFVVKVYVNGKQVQLLLDTGASITSIDSRVVDDLEVVKEGVVFGTANGKRVSNIYNVKNFTIGEITLNDFHVSGGAPLSNVDGLLGMNFLGKYKFKIDQRAAILFLGRKY